ncbi:MAG: M20/M25/M40 family metallo-hydrolase [Bacteroidota bacterium]
MTLYRSFSRIAVCVVLGTMLSLPALAQETRLSIEVDVVYLASDYLEGRETGTDGEARAAAYIANRFETLGLEPYNGSWYHKFDFTYSSNPHAAPGSGEARVGVNVAGYIDNNADHTVIVGAHYDHLGHGAFGSRQPNEPAIHNGADDNASGVAGVIEIARQLKAANATGNNYLFVGFSGEELGLYGSKAFVKQDIPDLDKVNYMINLDMVGRLNENNVLAINGTGTSPVWDEVLERTKPAGFDLKKHESGVGASDHTSFYLEDIPALHFFTGQHPDYHKASDDSPLVNFAGIEQIASYVVDVIEALDSPEAIAFTKTKDEQTMRSTFKVSMGIMPDYVADGVGLRIDAVMDDRPAAKAGLERGDIVVKLDEFEINNINDYMMALGKLEKGQKTTVVVKRGDKRVEKDIQF